MTEYIESEMQMQSKLIVFFENKQLKKKMYVGWSETDNYYVRGIDENQNVPFAFYIDTAAACLDFVHLFLEFPFVSVYNYNNMMYWDPSDLTYEFFETYRDDQYVIQKSIAKNNNAILKVLKLLTHSYNYECEYEEQKEEDLCIVNNK